MDLFFVYNLNFFFRVSPLKNSNNLEVLIPIEIDQLPNDR